MTTQALDAAFRADRDDRLAATIVTILVFAGGTISALMLGAAALSAIA